MATEEPDLNGVPPKISKRVTLVYTPRQCSVESTVKYNVESTARRRTLTSPYQIRQKRLIAACAIPNAGKFWFAHIGWKRTHAAALVGYLVAFGLLLAQCLAPAVYFTVEVDLTKDSELLLATEKVKKDMTFVTPGGHCGNEEFDQTCRTIVLNLFSKTFHLYCLYMTVFQVLLVLTCFSLTLWKFFSASKMDKFCLQQARIVFDFILLVISAAKISFAIFTQRILTQEPELLKLKCHTGYSLPLTLVSGFIFSLELIESRVILYFCHNITSMRTFLADFEVHQLMSQASK